MFNFKRTKPKDNTMNLVGIRINRRKTRKIDRKETDDLKGSLKSLMCVSQSENHSVQQTESFATSRL